MKFKVKDIQSSNRIFKIFKVEFDSAEIEKAITQAKLKSIHTNDENQNGDIRTSEKKFIKQFEGVLGEMAINEMLCQSFNKDNGCVVSITRWDDVRTDNFESPENEYDILISHENYKYYIESRASLNYKYHFTKTTLEQLDTIGKYSNNIKQNEKKSDFYIRPLFQLLEPNKDYTLDSFDFFDLFMKNQIILYITGGCNKQMMYGKNSIEKPLNQSKALYQTLSIERGWDVEELLTNIKLCVCDKENKI